MLHIQTALACVAIAALAGCSEPQVVSPYSGQPVTANRLMYESQTFATEQEAEEQAEAARAAAALRRLEREAEAEIGRLALTQEVEALDAQQAIDARIADVIDTRALERTQRQGRMAAMQSKFSSAMADLERQQEEQLAWLGVGQDVIQGAGSVIPGAGPIVGIAGLVLGGLGTILQRRRALHAEGQRDEAVGGARGVVDAIDALKIKSPQVAAAFDENKQMVHEWLGAAGVKFVKRLRDADS